MPPSKATIDRAFRLAESSREQGSPGPDVVVMTGDGGIAFERRSGNRYWIIEVSPDQGIAESLFVDFKLVSRRRVG